MRTIVRSGVALMLVGIMVSACAKTEPPAGQKADPAMIQASVDSISRAFMAAVAARDTDAIVSLYAADARMLPPNMPAAMGRDSIRATWVTFLHTPDMQLNTQTTQIISSDAGDLVVDVGTYTFSGKAPTGQAFTDVGKYVTVLKKVDGEWKMVVDTFNSDKPAMPGM
jgi:uncharacterized protein (TIGR02246 family)